MTPGARRTHAVRAVATAALVALALGCASRSPRDVVALYFRTLKGDPVRSLELLTPDFHLRHGIRRASGPADPAVARARTAAELPPGELSRLELGWILLLKLTEYRSYARGIAFDVTSESVDGDRAEVTAQVSLQGTDPFLQRFFLVREGPRAPWRIDRIEQEGVRPATRIAGFIAAPTQEKRREISAELGGPGS